MFPSQPQIGQDMAKERQQQAARIRQAQEASADGGPRREQSVRRRWNAAAALKRRLAALTARLGVPGIE